MEQALAQDEAIIHKKDTRAAMAEPDLALKTRLDAHAALRARAALFLEQQQRRRRGSSPPPQPSQATPLEQQSGVPAAAEVVSGDVNGEQADTTAVDMVTAALPTKEDGEEEEEATAGGEEEEEAVATTTARVEESEARWAQGAADASGKGKETQAAWPQRAAGQPWPTQPAQEPALAPQPSDESQAVPTENL